MKWRQDMAEYLRDHAVRRHLDAHPNLYDLVVVQVIGRVCSPGALLHVRLTSTTA